MSTALQSSLPEDDATELDLTCPACEANLILDDTFLAVRVCGQCNRHFSLGARERVDLLADPGSFQELAVRATGHGRSEPEAMPSADRVAEHHDQQVIAEALVTGVARVGGMPCLLIALDDHLVGSTFGVTMAEKIIVALHHATVHKLPVVISCTGGARTPPPGPLAVVQAGRLASAFAQLHLAGVPVIGILVHPVADQIYALLATHCDVIFAEPGTQVGTLGLLPAGQDIPGWQPADQLLATGWIDATVDRQRGRRQIAHLLDLFSQPGTIRPGGGGATGEPGNVPVAEVLTLLAHSERPNAAAYQADLFSGLVELRGDRVVGDTPDVTTGFARVESLSVAVVVVHRRPETEVAIAARKVARLARLASRLELPLVAIVNEGLPHHLDGFDPGAIQAVTALGAMLAVLPVPVLAIGTGVVASPLAQALMTGDRQFLLSNAVYAHGPGSAHDGAPFGRMPGQSRPGLAVLTARECERLGLVDGVILEPAPAAHVDPAGVLGATRSVLVTALAELAGTGPRRLLDTRYRRQRDLGLSTPEGLEAVRSELWEIQEWQRSVGRSLEDWRDRWDQFRSGANREPGRRIELPDVMTKLRARRDELLGRAGLAERATVDEPLDSSTKHTK